MKKISTILSQMPYILLAFMGLISVGIIFQYSVAVSWFPWAISHLIKALLFFPIIFFIGCLDVKTLYKHAYLIFAFSLLTLLLVQFFGHIGMGAQRWINLYIVKLQPSEFTKLSLMLFLSKLYSRQSEYHFHRNFVHIKAIFFSIIPIALVIMQPDLGTALLITGLLLFMLFLCGLKTRYIILGLICVATSLPILWHKLHDYQKQRITSFLNPESDPRGNGYHIIQSKIAIGSGGAYGKGFLQGTQSKLNFLPEKHTDFIFTSICEETGLIGALSIIILFIIIIINTLVVAFACSCRFSMLICFSTCFLLFEHVVTNIAMVSGLIPVVGVPLPFVSYGGSSLLSFCIMLGLVANASRNRSSRI